MKQPEFTPREIATKLLALLVSGCDNPVRVIATQLQDAYKRGYDTGWEEAGGEPR